MQERKSMEKADLSLLANPIQGRIYLKAALDRGDEQDFLQALHNVIDSLVDSEDRSSETSSSPTEVAVEAA